MHRGTMVWTRRVVAGLAVAAAMAACSPSGDSSPETGPTAGNAAASGAMTASPTPEPSTPRVMGPFAPDTTIVKDVRLTLHPQMAYVDYVKIEGKKVACADDMIAAELKFGRTIMIYDTPIVTSSGKGEQVQFNADGPFAGRALVINGSKATSIPEAVLTAETTSISLKEADWGPIYSVTVCAGAQ